MKKTLEQRRFRITWDDSGPFLLPVVPAQQFDRSQSQARTCRPCVHSILCCNNFRSTAPAFYGWSAPRSPRVCSGETLSLRSVASGPGGRRFVLDGFITRWWSTATVLEATQADGSALVCQPWSYLRLKAYSFLGLCEGA